MGRKGSRRADSSSSSPAFLNGSGRRAWGGAGTQSDAQWVRGCCSCQLLCGQQTVGLHCQAGFAVVQVFHANTVACRAFFLQMVHPLAALGKPCLADEKAEGALWSLLLRCSTLFFALNQVLLDYPQVCSDTLCVLWLTLWYGAAEQPRYQCHQALGNPAH